MTFNFKTILSLATALLLFILSSCLKKSEDDPLVSFRTRKNRVTGDWKMQSGRIVNATTSQTVEVVITENTFVNTTVFQSGSSFTYSGTTSGKAKIEKDGVIDYSFPSVSGPEPAKRGKWNFTGNIGEYKSKECLIIESGHSPAPEIYVIKELRNKKLVLFQKWLDSSNDGTMELVFIQ